MGLRRASARRYEADHDSRRAAAFSVLQNDGTHAVSDFRSALLTRKNHPEDSGNRGQVGELNFGEAALNERLFNLFRGQHLASVSPQGEFEIADTSG